MVAQLTLNPVTGQWEMLTTDQWRRLKAGYGKDQEVPEHEIDFKIDLKFAINKWARCKEYPAVQTHILEVMVKTLTLEPLAQAELCLWFYHSFHYPELEKSQAKIQTLRSTIREIKRLSEEVRANAKRSKRRKRR